MKEVKGAGRGGADSVLWLRDVGPDGGSGAHFSESLVCSGAAYRQSPLAVRSAIQRGNSGGIQADLSFTPTTRELP